MKAVKAKEQKKKDAERAAQLEKELCDLAAQEHFEGGMKWDELELSPNDQQWAALASRMDFFLPVPEKLPKMVTAEIIDSVIKYDQAMVKHKVSFHQNLQLV